jgi:ubiquinone/menaquinone biosynthesis C-methylase UbiE
VSWARHQFWRLLRLLSTLRKTRIGQRAVCPAADLDQARHRTDSVVESSKIAQYWDKHVGEHLAVFSHWEANEPVMHHQNVRVSGRKDVTALEWFYRKYGPFENVANIGTGTGILESALCSLPDFRGQVLGYDISPHSLEVARRNCAAFANARFETADLNKKVWESERFDVVMAHGALHHIESLKWCLGQIYRGLRLSGLLYVNDYVGPDRFQWSDDQMRLANELLETVPSKWLVRRKVVRCDPEQLRRQDPSEAVCSHFIEETIRAHFQLVERIPRGGTLLAPIFGSGCLDRSILDSPEGFHCIAELADKESRLIDDGILPSDHVVIVAEKRKPLLLER